MHPAEAPRSESWRIAKLFMLAIFACCVLVAADQGASAQVTIVSEGSGVTNGRQLQLGGAAPFEPFAMTVPNAVPNGCLVVGLCVGKQTGTLSGLRVFWDPDGAGPTGETELTQIVGIFYEGNSPNALRGIHLFYFNNPPAGVGWLRVTNANGTNGLHMAGYAYMLQGVLTASPFNSICTDTDPNSTPEASCTVGTSANNGLVLDWLVMVESRSIAGETPTPKGVLTDPFRQDTSLDSGGQDLRAASGAFVNTSTSPSAITGYTLPGVSNAFLMVTLGFNPANLTPVGLDSFTGARFTKDAAGAYARQGVLLQWHAGYETNNIGYVLYRQGSDGKRVRVTPQLVAGSALSTKAALSAGYSYAWWDPNGSEYDTYWLEDVDSRGKTALNGPISPIVVEGAAPSVGSSQTIDKLAAATPDAIRVVEGPALTGVRGTANGKAVIPVSGGGKPGAGNLQTQWQVASLPGVKLSVRERGWYRVTGQDLVDLGVDTSRFDPRTIQLFADGVEQAVRVTGDADGHFDAADTVEFFGAGVDVQSTDTRTYYLTAGSAVGKRIRVLPAQVAQPTPVTFPYSVERKDRTIYVGNVDNGDRENFFGNVLFDSVDTHLGLAAVAPGAGTARVEVGVQGFDATSHQVQVSLNGQVLGVVNGEGSTYATASYTVPQSLLHEGDNVVTLTRLGSTVHLVDFVRVTYQRQSTATANQLILSVPGRQPVVTVDGFTSSDVRLVDVTDPSTVQDLAGRITGGGTQYAITAPLPSSSSRTLFAFAGDQVKRPAAFELNTPSTWNRSTNGADVVMITNSAFAGELGTLQALRASQGLSVAVVDVEDIYDEFSFGYHAPAAIKAFLANAAATWSHAPRFVLLVGDASYDPRNYLGLGHADFIPTRLVDTSYYQAASDDWLADRNGDDVPDVAIGRLPVRTAAEAATIVGKIVSYETSGAPSTRTAVFVNDAPNGGNFAADSAAVAALFPSSYAQQSIDRGVLGDDAAHAQTVTAIDAGASVVNYSGHGSVTTWAGNVLTNADAPQLTNSGGLSVFTIQNCLNNYFHASIGDSLGEALLKSPDGGAVAVWASSGVTPSTTQQPLVLEFYRQLFGNTSLTVGEAAARAKSAAPSGTRQLWVLLGDPVTKLK